MTRGGPDLLSGLQAIAPGASTKKGLKQSRTVSREVKGQRSPTAPAPCWSSGKITDIANVATSARWSGGHGSPREICNPNEGILSTDTLLLHWHKCPWLAKLSAGRLVGSGWRSPGWGGGWTGGGGGLPAAATTGGKILVRLERRKRPGNRPRWCKGLLRYQQG